MWKSILDWIKGLFSGNGSMQIGKDNLSASGTTGGAYSPVVNARGDVHLTISPEREPSELFNLVLQEFNGVKEVLKRGIDSTELRQKKKVAKHLFETCKAWSRILCETFDAAAQKWEQRDMAGAGNDILILESEFYKLDYYHLEESSPTLQNLKQDDRFAPMTEACAGFFKCALYVKGLVHGEFIDSAGNYSSHPGTGVRHLVVLWKEELDKAMRKVSFAYQSVEQLADR